MGVFDKLTGRKEPLHPELEKALESMGSVLQAFAIPNDDDMPIPESMVEEAQIFFADQIAELEVMQKRLEEEKSELEKAIADVEKTLVGYRAGLNALGGTEHTHEDSPRLNIHVDEEVETLEHITLGEEPTTVQIKSAERKAKAKNNLTD